MGPTLQIRIAILSHSPDPAPPNSFARSITALLATPSYQLFTAQSRALNHPLPSSNHSSLSANRQATRSLSIFDPYLTFPLTDEQYFSPPTAPLWYRSTIAGFLLSVPNTLTVIQSISYCQCPQQYNLVRNAFTTP